MEPDALIALTEQAKHCHVVPEATNDASLGRFYAENGFLTELDGLPDKVFELLDFQLLGRRIREAEGGIFTRQGFVAPDGTGSRHKALRPASRRRPRGHLPS